MEAVRTLAAASVVLLVTVALSGCSGPPGLERDDPPDSDDPPGTGGGGGPGDGTGLPTPERPERSAMLLSFGLEDCTGVESVVSLDAAAAQATLPDGYTVATDGPAGAATARYVWAQCGGLRTPTASVNGTAFGSVSLRVEPPEAAADADEHWYRFRVLAQDDLLHALWVAAGYDVVVGEYADLSQVASSPVGGTAPEDRDVRLAGYGAQGLVTVAAPTGSVRAAHYTQTEGGRLEWVGVFGASATRTLVGSLDLPSDDPLGGVPAAPGAPEAVLSQRYLDAAAWTETDLWLRETGRSR